MRSVVDKFVCKATGVLLLLLRLQNAVSYYSLLTTALGFNCFRRDMLDGRRHARIARLLLPAAAVEFLGFVLDVQNGLMGCAQQLNDGLVTQVFALMSCDYTNARTLHCWDYAGRQLNVST